MDFILSSLRIVWDGIWRFFFRTESSNLIAVNDKHVPSPADDAKARRAAFLLYFLNDTKPCDKYEVLYFKRNIDICPAPPIPLPKNTTDIAIVPVTTPAPDISRYYPFIGILILFLGVSLVYIIKQCLRIFRSNVKFGKQLTKKKNMNSIVRATTVLVVGANETGKKSIITTFKKMYPESKTWNFITQHLSERRIPSSSVPDVIWLVVNYQASIHDNELKILEHADNIPVILVINKVDLLQEINLNDDNVIKNFNERVPNCLEKYERLMDIRKRLLQSKKPMVILSLRQEESNDRELGMNNLIEITNACLLNKTLENNLQNSFHYDGVHHQLKAIHNNSGLKFLFCTFYFLFHFIEMIKSNIRILLIGYTSTGKSSLINFFVGNNVAPISFTGLPVTEDMQEYVLPDLNLTLIDSMGLEKKRDNTEKLEKLREYDQPDFVWFLVNYQSSIEEDELNLIKELFPLIPTIIVINFMDILQTFDHEIDFETDNHQQYQIERQRLLKFKQNQTNVQHIIAISLRTEEQDDRPRGLKLLYDKTIQNFLKNTII
jgi:tRNA U34 5-carboxymethylaminomethyl modifying GTPase MnmE/TrmE